MSLGKTLRYRPHPALPVRLSVLGRSCTADARCMFGKRPVPLRYRYLEGLHRGRGLTKVTDVIAGSIQLTYALDGLLTMISVHDVSNFSLAPPLNIPHIFLCCVYWCHTVLSCPVATTATLVTSWTLYSLCFCCLVYQHVEVLVLALESWQGKFLCSLLQACTHGSSPGCLKVY